MSYAGIVSEVTIEGNKKTKVFIFHRELTFHIGDTIDPGDYDTQIKQSENNLLNTSLFNFASISITDSGKFTKVKIKVTERWYIWPQVILSFQDRNFTEWVKTANFSRVDYGVSFSHFNFRGKQERLKLQFKTGFNTSAGIKYEIPYLTKSLKAGLKIELSYNSQSEVFTNIDSANIMSFTTSDNLLLESWNGHIEYRRRNNLYFRNYYMIDFKAMKLHNQLIDQRDSYFGGQNNLNLVTLTYMFKNDHRDSKNYPLVGFYHDLQVQQSGIGIDKSNMNVTRLTTDYRHYYFLKSRWYFAYSAYAQAYSSEDVPFFIRDGLGFRHYVRSYEPYVLFGQLSGLTKALLKFQVLKPRVHTIPYVKAEKFNKLHYAVFLNIFVDAGYVQNNRGSKSRLNNEFLLGGGVGLDFVTFYDLVFRVEYSINKYKEHGFYLSFVSPI